MITKNKTYDGIGLILGNCLFKSHKDLGKNLLYFMKEDVSLCTHFKYHKHKLILFLSAMRHHRDLLNDVKYYDINQKLSFEEALLETMEQKNLKKIFSYEIEDKFFEERINIFCEKNNFELKIIRSQGFLTSKEEFRAWKSKNKLFMHNFYIWQRKRLNILVTDSNQPVNGKWSFDDENRKPLPKNLKLPSVNFPKPTKHVKDVSEIVDRLFSDHIGSSDNFYLPVTREDSLLWLDDFFKHRFESFGPYEDAIDKNETFLFHSVLSPLINLGLLTPGEVIDKVLSLDVHYPSKEGFIRQIIGWREFIRGVYNTTNLETNFFNHKTKLPLSFYQGTTGIDPFDSSVKKVLQYSYNHHIERLMVLSNFMLLCEIDPDDVYKWFMELYVDSSDWVMAPNVYGMGQFASNTFATKPYISGSNYILKMSNFEKGEWCEIWDGLYWRFINKKREFFMSNPRMRMMVTLYDKMDESKKQNLISKAEKFLQNINKNG